VCVCVCVCRRWFTSLPTDGVKVLVLNQQAKVERTPVSTDAVTSAGNMVQTSASSKLETLKLKVITRTSSVSCVNFA